MQSSRAHSGGAFRHRDMGFLLFNEKSEQMEFMCSDNTGNFKSYYSNNPAG